MVGMGIAGPGSELDEALAREQAGKTGVLGEFLASLDTAGRREAALALHRRACRGPDEELVRPALADLSRQELGWSAAEADTLLVRLLGRDAEVAPHELEASFPTLVPIALSAADQAGEFDRPRVRVLRSLAESLRAHQQDLFGLLRDRMDVLLAREVPVRPGVLPRHLLDGFDAYGPEMRAAHGELLARAGVPEFLAHCALLDRPRATKAWRRESAARLTAAEGGAEVARLLLEGIAVRPEHRVNDPDLCVTAPPTLADAANTSLVRGLLWASLDVEADWVVPSAGAVALHAGTGAGGAGGGVCRSRALAVTAVAVLGACGGARGVEAARWLDRLPGQVRNRTVLKAVERARGELGGHSGG